MNIPALEIGNLVPENKKVNAAALVSPPNCMRKRAITSYCRITLRTSPQQLKDKIANFKLFVRLKVFEEISHNTVGKIVKTNPMRISRNNLTVWKDKPQ